MTWPLHMREQTARRLRDGWSASQIGAEIGKSRNSVIGMVHRDAELRSIGFMRRPGQRMFGDRKDERLVKVTRPAKVVVEPAREPQVAGITLMMVGRRQCKWAVNDAAPRETHLFCGTPTELGAPYCEYHSGRSSRKNQGSSS